MLNQLLINILCGNRKIKMKNDPQYSEQVSYIGQVSIGELMPRKWPQWLSRCSSWLLTQRGWTVKGELINAPKAILAVAPHTSNWDFFIGLLVVFSCQLKLSFFGKHSIFVPPLGYIVRKLGGIPIERSRAHGVVTAIASQISQSEDLILALAPEGSRKAAFPWKQGFVHIAKQAQIPIQLIGLDYKHKQIVFGPVIREVTNTHEQMQTICAFYGNVCGKYPKNCITQP